MTVYNLILFRIGKCLLVVTHLIKTFYLSVLFLILFILYIFFSYGLCIVSIIL